MNSQLKSALAVSALILATQAAAQITFYEGENFRGRAFTADKRVNNLERNRFNDRASSVVVDRGRWEVCENTSGTPAYWDVTYNFRGRDHQLQMSAAPGTTIAVNGNGEPRQ